MSELLRYHVDAEGKVEDKGKGKGKGRVEDECSGKDNTIRYHVDKTDGLGT